MKLLNPVGGVPIAEMLVAVRTRTIAAIRILCALSIMLATIIILSNPVIITEAIITLFEKETANKW